MSSNNTKAKSIKGQTIYVDSKTDPVAIQLLKAHGANVVLINRPKPAKVYNVITGKVIG